MKKSHKKALYVGGALTAITLSAIAAGIYLKKRHVEGYIEPLTEVVMLEDFTWTYEDEFPDQIRQFKTGDLVVVVKDDGDGWTVVAKSVDSSIKCGVVPSTYLEATGNPVANSELKDVIEEWQYRWKYRYPSEGKMLIDFPSDNPKIPSFKKDDIIILVQLLKDGRTLVYKKSDGMKPRMARIPTRYMSSTGPLGEDVKSFLSKITKKKQKPTAPKLTKQERIQRRQQLPRRRGRQATLQTSLSSPTSPIEPCPDYKSAQEIQQLKIEIAKLNDNLKKCDSDLEKRKVIAGIIFKYRDCQNAINAAMERVAIILSAGTTVYSGVNYKNVYQELQRKKNELDFAIGQSLGANSLQHSRDVVKCKWGEEANKIRQIADTVIARERSIINTANLKKNISQQSKEINQLVKKRKWGIF